VTEVRGQIAEVKTHCANGTGDRGIFTSAI
jgi:hypothetical protein